MYTESLFFQFNYKEFSKCFIPLKKCKIAFLYISKAINTP